MRTTNEKAAQTKKAAQAANSVKFDDNAEIDNIKRRLELTADPGKLGFIVLFNYAGVSFEIGYGEYVREPRKSTELSLQINTLGTFSRMRRAINPMQHGPTEQCEP